MLAGAGTLRNLRRPLNDTAGSDSGQVVGGSSPGGRREEGRNIQRAPLTDQALLEPFSGEAGSLPTLWLEERRLTALGSFPELQKPGGAGMQARPRLSSRGPPACCTGPPAPGSHSLCSQVARLVCFSPRKPVLGTWPESRVFQSSCGCGVSRALVVVSRAGLWSQPS